MLILLSCTIYCVTDLRVTLMPRRVYRRPISPFESHLQMLRVVVERLAPDQQRVKYHTQAVNVRCLRQGLKKTARV